ncbi:MAG: patatin-like phospholipase family protein [Xanthobacteraceae bacterium]
MSIQHSAARPRIGLALGSGAARGWAHIGVIDALLGANIEPDIVCGTSIGALVGAAYVADRLPALKDFVQALTLREIVGFLDVRLSGGGIIDGKRIVALLRDLKVAAPIESYRKPYAAVATDLETGREIWLREGPIDEAVRASISIPGIFSPTKLADRWLADGGLVNPVPVSTCRALGADIVIAVNLNGDILGRFEDNDIPRTSATEIDSSPEFLRRLLNQIPAAIRQQASAIAPKLLRSGPAAPGYFDVLTSSINVMQDQITRARLAGEPPHVLLVPRLRAVGLLEFNRAAEAIAEGRACVQQALAALQRYL